MLPEQQWELTVKGNFEMKAKLNQVQNLPADLDLDSP